MTVDSKPPVNHESDVQLQEGQISLEQALNQGGPMPGETVVIVIPKEAHRKAAKKFRHLHGCVFQGPQIGDDSTPGVF